MTRTYRSSYRWGKAQLWARQLRIVYRWVVVVGGRLVALSMLNSIAGEYRGPDANDLCFLCSM